MVTKWSVITRNLFFGGGVGRVNGRWGSRVVLTFAEVSSFIVATAVKERMLKLQTNVRSSGWLELELVSYFFGGGRVGARLDGSLEATPGEACRDIHACMGFARHGTARPRGSRAQAVAEELLWRRTLGPGMQYRSSGYR